jgi:hypothetical protein
VVFAAVCIMVGVYWDISWHMSIGRDTFWTAPHLLMQAGGLIAGLSSGYVALMMTFARPHTDHERGGDAAVRLWGFRAPLGAWVCVWGCIAMVASAPFDNWWHNAYGLDVQIVSPPHAILAMGIYAIMWGSLLLTLAKYNGAVHDNDERRVRRYGRLYLVTGGLLVMNFAIFLTEYSEHFQQHGPLFYILSAITYPFALVTVAWGSRSTWGATGAAAAYMTIMLALMWIIQLFPATPGLAPIYQPITRMVTMDFPLLLVVPAAAMDVIRHRLDRQVATPLLAILLGVVFVAAFVAVQWPFAGFLTLNPMARGWLFNADNFVFWSTPWYTERSHTFLDSTTEISSFAVAAACASVSALVGLGWGRWMSKVRR